MAVCVLIGVAGAGKTTFAKKEFPDWTKLSTDDFFTDENGNYKIVFAQLGEAHGSTLRYFVSSVANPDAKVVVDNTNTTLGEIAPYIALALAYGHELRVFHLVASPSVAAKRNVHGVPMKNVEAMDIRIEEMMEDWPPFWPKPEVIHTT